MKKKLCVLPLLLLLCALLPVSVLGTQTEENSCGETMTWSFSGDTLTITGSGEMDDFEDEAPWSAHRDEIAAVVLEGDITYIGARAFKNYDALKLVDFGQALYEIGEEAFYSCDGLTAISLPKTFKVFGPSSFLGCGNLKEIHCAGRFPSFRQNSMWDTYATIYYPVDNPWPSATIDELETAFKGRIRFLASDGTDPYAPAETTEPATDPTQPSTEPEEESTGTTEAPTQPPTEAPTQPAWETSEPTQPAETTRPTLPSEPSGPAGEEESGGSGVLLIVLVAVVSFFAGIVLVFRLSGKRGRYSARQRRR